MRRRAWISGGLAGLAGIWMPWPRSAWQSVHAESMPDPAEIDPSTLSGAPGFFRVGRQRRGRWTLLDPAGKPFFLKGVAAVNRSGLLKGRKAYRRGPYTATLERKFGSDPRAFRDDAVRRLRTWGFNALGSWCDEDLWGGGLAYTVLLDLVESGPVLRTAGTFLPDLFDPAWVKAAEDRVRGFCRAHSESRLLVGYFTDNQLGWGMAATAAKDGDPPMKPGGAPTLLQWCLALAPGRPAQAAAWDFVTRLHGERLEDAARSWQVPLRSRAQLREWTAKRQAIVSRGFVADAQAFLAEYARRYFQVAADLIRRHDPNHLILGNRFNLPPLAPVAAECRRPSVDVVSVTDYGPNAPEQMEAYHRATGLPVLAADVTWAKAEFYNDPAPGEPPGLTADARRLRSGLAVMERMFAVPSVVGYCWYRWVDVPETPGVKSRFGLVTIEDEPKAGVVEAITGLNARADEIVGRAET